MTNLLLLSQTTSLLWECDALYSKLVAISFHYAVLVSNIKIETPVQN